MEFDLVFGTETILLESIWKILWIQEHEQYENFIRHNKSFKSLLKGYDVEFVTLKDLAITDEPEENGTTPEENAIAKAKFYGQYFEVVICNDSGLYFEELALDDVRQPGLNVRTPMQMDRLSDEEMIGKASSKRFEGWPLDSLSMNKETGKYFGEAEAKRVSGNFAISGG